MTENIILFDYFGVIASDAYWYTVQDQESGIGNGERIKHMSDDVNTGRLSWADFCKQVAADLGVAVEEVEERYNRHNINRGVVDIARSLAEAGHSVSLASNASKQHLDPILEKTGLDRLFERTFYSSDIGYAKPDQGFFEAILSSYTLPAEKFVFIDDSTANTDAAEKIGMDVVHFESTEQLIDNLERIL